MQTAHKYLPHNMLQRVYQLTSVNASIPAFTLIVFYSKFPRTCDSYSALRQSWRNTNWHRAASEVFCCIYINICVEINGKFYNNGAVSFFLFVSRTRILMSCGIRVLRLRSLLLLFVCLFVGWLVALLIS